jgi:molecular chaperone DnaK
VKVIKNSHGRKLTPSTVAFLKDELQLVGIAAKLQAAINPHNTIASAKRMLGKR